MTVYIEDCLIENFLVTLLLLLTEQKLFKIKICKHRLVLSCLFASGISVCYPTFGANDLLLIFFKIGVGILIVSIAFSKDKFLVKLFCFLFLTALYAGMNILIYILAYGTLNIQDNFPTYILIAILFSIYYMLNSCINLFQKKNTIYNFVYKISLFIDDKVIEDVGFLDSGNTLLDSLDNTPVFIINHKLFTKLYKNITFEDLLTKSFKNLKSPHYLKSSFATGGGKILVFEVDGLEIQTNEKVLKFKNVKLGLSYSKFEKNFNCNMLLNINAFV